MDITLTRVDYAQIGTASKGCMRVISADKDDKKKKTKNLDKVVCGGHSGVVLCITRKNAETQVVFKTMPGPRIDCLRLGGALGTIQDKIFISCENYVKGYSKKGKQFFAFETNMAEPISSMYIYGVDMFLCGRLSFNHYHDCADANYYLCNERINDVLCLPVVEGSWVGRGITPVLACDDKTIKVLQGSELNYEVQLGDIPSVLHLFMNDGGFSKQRVLYGTKDGRIGLVDLPPKDGTLVWEIPTQSTSAITSIHCYAITGSGCPDIIIGKEDGLIEIYIVDFSDQASFKKSFQCEESIVSLQCGRVSSESFDEIVVCTYTGWVFALSTEPVVMPRKDALTTLAPHLEVKVQQVRNELEELEQKVSEERQRYHELTLQEGSAIAVVPRFAIQDQFTLDKTLACYTLSIELIVPIDYILLQSDVGVELLDVEKNSAVVSITTPDEKSGNALLATYRCQANTTRIEMRIRSIEGQYGTVQAYICPKIHPKMCQVRAYSIKPLSLHQRVHEFDASRPVNILRIMGNFSLSEAHQWISMLVSQVPERVPPQESVTFNFASTFNGGTQLQAIYSRGSAVYRSDNISTIAIIRDVLSREVTRRQIKVDIQCEMNEESIAHTLQLLHPKMVYQNNLMKRLQLAQALKELSDNGDDLSYLSGEMRGLLESYDKLHEEALTYGVHLDRLIGIITDLYIDKERMAGRNGKAKIEELLRILSKYDATTLHNFFMGKNVTQQ